RDETNGPRGAVHDAQHASPGHGQLEVMPQRLDEDAEPVTRGERHAGDDALHRRGTRQQARREREREEQCADQQPERRKRLPEGAILLRAQAFRRAQRYRPLQRAGGPDEQRRHVTAGLAGSVSTNSLPRPGPSLCAVSSPPCSSTSPRATFWPMPSPCPPSSVDTRLFEKRSKISPNASGGIPIPVSVTPMRTRS